MNRTRIEYADYTWNPVTGCLHGCEYCYARRLANGRLRHIYLGRDRLELSARAGDSFAPRFGEEAPLMPVKPSRIFVCNMGDLFGDWVPDEVIKTVLRQAKWHNDHTFLFLTKNPSRLADVNPWPANARVGASIDTQARWTPTLDALAKVEAAVKWISFEPLLEMLPASANDVRDAGIRWAVIGGRSGKPTRYPLLDWVVDLELQLAKAGVAVFEKNNLYADPDVKLIQEYP